jgi:uncharacterized protein
MNQTDVHSRRFIAEVRVNPTTAALLDRLPALGLPDCWLVAGCLFQTIWNTQSGRPPAEHIADYDVFYFDPTDLSYEAEDAQIRRLADAVADLPAKVELKNQARVHLWYLARFGHGYPQLQSSTQGIDRFLVACTCVGISCKAHQPPQVYATHGLDDLYRGHLAPNPRHLNPALFAAKTESYRRRWLWLTVSHEPATPPA